MPTDSLISLIKLYPDISADIAVVKKVDTLYRKLPHATLVQHLKPKPTLRANASVYGIDEKALESSLLQASKYSASPSKHSGTGSKSSITTKRLKNAFNPAFAAPLQILFFAAK